MKELTDHHPLIRFGQEQAARLLAAYLNEQGIKAFVNEAPQQDAGDSEAIDSSHSSEAYLLSIEDLSQKDAAVDIAQEFLKNPNAPKFQQAAWSSGELARSRSPILASSGLPGVSDILKAPFTVLVMACCLFVFGASMLGYFDFWQQALSMQYFDQLAENHQWWRLFGPAFLHFSAIHIIFNLMWWWIFGGQLERVFGTFWLIVLFVVSNLFANISQLLVSGPNFGGLSGVVYALFGFVWWIGWLRPKWGISIPNGFVIFLLVWLALGYADLLYVSMANEAHTFGLIAGCLLALSLHLLVPKAQKTSH
uniref:rhomboid family intramembrane serine protease n=1 Tax=Ningiella ruwaisensis TaxID=2364274 RepID=UPI00109EF6D3|nr:rhomboid family intramembrane serine protease [Ningiella ruwaisensis]